jgi:glyoxalase family protein
MVHAILGLHHVTATVDDAQADLDFFGDALALRLVKQTVNFDNRNVYHFYYGDERGTPGTLWTTFPYRGQGVRVGTKGAAQVMVTSFAVPAGSLGFWHERLKRRGVEAHVAPSKFGEEALMLSDRSGLLVELVETARDDRAPWTGGGVGEGAAVRGLHSVTLAVKSRDRTLALLTDVLGFKVMQDSAARVRVAAGGEGPGHAVDILDVPRAQAGVNGLGTVHHVAFAIGTPEEQQRLREDLLDRGYRVTPVMDRCYFRSIYFREPGGVLFEVATIDPGFLADEPIDALGRQLRLPPWEEPNRPAIEAGLPPITLPAPAATGTSR